MAFRQGRFGAADLQPRTDAVAQTTLGQVQDLFLLGKIGPGDIHLRVQQRQPDIAAHQVALQLQGRQARLGHGYAGLVQGLVAAAALTSPEIEVVGKAQQAGVVPAGGAAKFAGAVEVIVGPALALQVGIEVDLGLLGRLHHPGQGAGPAYTGGGHGQAGAAGQRLFHPGVQLRVAIGAPPLGAGPGGIALGAANGRTGVQATGVQALGLGARP